ncbi:MAG: sulfatase [Cyclobacteriaceae bacterium]|nr:sulfatase [Cyclobacteriaceae bacterium]
MRAIPVLLFYLLSLFSCRNDHGTDPGKPNILWIVADDLGTDLGCYGEGSVMTPNLDQFATEGTRYTNFFTVTAVCSPSRSTLITGMYPVSIDAHQHRTQFKKPLPDPVKPVTHYFREAGYFTFNSDFRNPQIPGKQDYNFSADDIYDGTHWSACPEGMPFFGQIQIFYPHRPFIRDTLNPVDSENLEIPPYYPDHPLTRKDWAQYLEFIQLLDREFGKVMKELDQAGLLSNTVIFFFGDQGRPHVRAKQFLYDGGINTPLIIRFPDQENKGRPSDQLISNIDIPVTSLYLAGIKIPGHLQGNNVFDDEREYIFAMRDRRDETVDRIRAVRSKQYKYIRNFYPERPYTQFNAYKKFSYPVLTLMEVLNEQGKLSEAQSIFMEANRPPEELYDVLNDPFEINNLANDPESGSILEKYGNVLDEWLKMYDKGTYPEDSSEIRYARELMEKNYRSWMEGIGLDENTGNEELLDYWYEYLGIEE